MKAISLFSGAGIGESRLSEIGIDVILANELRNERAQLYRLINPHSQIVQGDIIDNSIFQLIVGHTTSPIDLVIATPPCQGVSIAGKNRKDVQQLADQRNYLLFPIIEAIKAVRPVYALIENVPQYLKLVLPHMGKLQTVEQILRAELGDLYSVESLVWDCADLGVPQSRKRAFIKIFEKGKNWPWPRKADQQICLKEAIGDLPSLEAGEVSGIPWHFARKHAKKHVEWLAHTPTGKTAFDNPVYFPKGINGVRIKAYETTYRRMRWDRPAPAITMRNDAISSQTNVHPGRLKRNGQYSDARVLTPLELFIINSMELAPWQTITASEVLVRRVLGEGVPPLAMNRIIGPLVGS